MEKKVTLITKGAVTVLGKRYRIEYDRNGCIGAAACSAVSDKWIISQEDGKADPTIWEFDEDELEEQLEAARSCPAQVIHIVDNETGQRLI